MGRRIALLYSPQTVNDPPSPSPIPFLIPCWEWNLRNVVLMCWDVMMVGDRWPSVSLVFTRAPPKKKSPPLKDVLVESGFCRGLPVPLLSLFRLWGETMWVDSEGGEGTIIQPAFSLFVWLFSSLILLVYLYIYVMNYLLFFCDLHNKMLYCDLYGNIWPHIFI